jgi:twitching motility protein PilJ
MKDFFKKKNKHLDDALNTALDTKTDSLGVNTEIAEKAGFDKISKIKVVPVGIFTFIALLGAILTYVNYSIDLDKNRQKVAHIADLRQLGERIEKSALLARNADKTAFDELNTSEKQIDKLLNVLENGGKVSSENTEIGPIEPQFATQFHKVTSEWKANKPLIDTLVGQEGNLTDLRQKVDVVRQSTQDLIDATAAFQKVLQAENNAKASQNAQELLLLSNRINQGVTDLFSGESFSLEKGYSLVKDLKTFNLLVTGLRMGNSTYDISALTDTNALNALNVVENNFSGFKALTGQITSQVGTLYNAKDVALQVSKSSHDIVKTAEDLNSAFTEEAGSLSVYRLISIVLFVLSLAGMGLLALVFYERSIQAFRFAKVLGKNQANEMAVNMLLEQMRPLDEGNFTRRVFVDDKFVSPIAEKVDNTREILGSVVRKIKQTAESIFSAADNTEQTSQKLLEVSSAQYQQLGNTIVKLGRITSEMDEVSQTTWLAQEDSNQSKQASQSGEKLVRESIAKMDEIRGTIQESSKKIKKSSESAQAINEVTGLIQDITKQIEVLALNAAIQAASSGESGREFTVVAQEVQRLAFDSKEATNQIFELVKEVQQDIAGAVSSMEKTTQEVVEGAKLTDSAGQALKKIEELSELAANRVMEASSKLEEKSAEMANMSLEMQELQNVTEQSQQIVKDTAEQVESLKTISEEMNASVHGYQVE